MFRDAHIIPGNEPMPSLSGENQKGPFGNGFARVTCIGPQITFQQVQFDQFMFSFIIFDTL